MDQFSHRLLTGSSSDQDEEQDVGETTTLLEDQQRWKAPKGFIWIEIAIFANVFLSGFDGTITASTYALIASEFSAANTASWLTTSYLITYTAFQPLYGRFSDIFGRRICFFIATLTFMIGCLGCGLAKYIWLLNTMRALTGVGGGGLMTVATIVNSDLIPFRKRGAYQAVQNVLFGFGSICGASVGGAIADTIGWRWCFLLQVPISLLALGIGHVAIKSPENLTGVAPDGDQKRSVWGKLDIAGATLLILSLSSQLVALSLGGNELPWSSPWVISTLVGSVVLLALFLVVEAKTKAMPVIPLRMLHGKQPVATQLANVFFGMAAYAYLFLIPLFFQVVLLESATKAGSRLVIPSLATPVGGVIAGVVMSRWGKLAVLVRVGAFLMLVGNALAASLSFRDADWKYIVYLFPANLGQGMAYPGTLFTFLAIFDHSDHAVSSSTVYLIRSLGTVWGVAVTSAITQNVLKSRLPVALGEIPNKWRVIDEVRHSVAALRDLPLEVRMSAQMVYYEGIRLAFIASSGFAFIGFVAALFTRGKGLERT
ncbi:MFS general substrate transporter [Rhizodiscina lignyota]|uniref:MFS general substrate transporter n=1 Tax=Rhizodiscina lignyota TaxID=1504668 RepID=A0A9P4MCZ6_9PEZI|nr:MFS general substrate transporter [Rhizodiscina lignyota]